MRRRDAFYIGFPKVDNTFVSVIPCEVKEPVKLHCHTYYEFAIVTKGSCQFHYRDVDSVLIPGDVFLIQPHELHSYDVSIPAMITNVHFFPEELRTEYQGTLPDIAMRAQLQRMDDVRKQWDELIRYITLKNNEITERTDSQAERMVQEIIHLTSDEMKYVDSLLNDMIGEQKREEEGIEYAKQAYLMLILVFFKRIKAKEYQRIRGYTSQKKTMVYETIAYMERHLSERINFSEITENIYLNPNYFRAIFKDITGLTPMEYLNRIRIVKSLEYLGTDGVSITEVASRVGIYDANYFSRVFKKIMGYSPRYFKKIR